MFLSDHSYNDNFEFYGTLDEVMPSVLSFRGLQICSNCATHWTGIAITELLRKKTCGPTVQTGELEGKTGNVSYKTKCVTHKKKLIQIHKFSCSAPCFSVMQ